MPQTVCSSSAMEDHLNGRTHKRRSKQPSVVCTWLIARPFDINRLLPLLFVRLHLFSLFSARWKCSRYPIAVLLMKIAGMLVDGVRSLWASTFSTKLHFVAGLASSELCVLGGS